ncbi:tyrosinase family oxidase copper chaperone [Streptomyces sp. WAC 01529]|uniref:tyrosinase family oxidase copper chaperone n=1 Tax=Streptomyces sp. WAC 01529 TaxID=2203205 RepID=UPI0019CF8485|nr:tyrosinase family oxidase copper chaperone [Streptomyces sp. WAC 01529]
MTRRHLLGVAASALLAAGSVFRLAQAPREASPPVALDDPPSGEPLPGAPLPGEPSFDEMYRGRRIQGESVASRDPHAPGGWSVTVDGRPLGLMRRADGGYLSTVDHFQSYATPLAAARAAVDELGPSQALSGRGH